MITKVGKFMSKIMKNKYKKKTCFYSCLSLTMYT